MRPLLSALATVICGLLVQNGLGQVPRASAGQPDPQRPTFRAQINLVEIDVVALDRANQPVTGLTQQEFEILENGVLKDIVTFAQVELPVPPARAPAVNDVASNVGSGEGRLIFLVLDDANSLETRTNAIKQAARRLVERLSPNDHVGLLWVSLSRKGAREFTSNHAAILSAIDSFEAGQAPIERRLGPQSATDFPRDPEGGMSEDSLALATLNLKALFDAARPFVVVQDVSKHLTALDRRRKAIVYIGQGARMLSTRPDDPVDDLRVLRAIDAAQSSNVTVYSIDPSTPAGTGPDRPESVDEFARLAAATGGFAAFRTDVFEAVDRVLNATNAYYLLGYSADPAAPADDPRRIEVRTTRPDVRILARKNYRPTNTTASVDGRQAALTAARELVPRSALDLRAFAAPFRGASSKEHPVAIAVEVRASEFAKSAPVKVSRDDVRLVVLAIEPGARVRQTHQVSGRVTLTPENARAASGGRYVLFTRIDLAPGQYQLRIGVHSAAAGRSGSVYCDLTVPDFRKQPVALSGLVIGQATSATPVPAGRAATIASLVPFTPVLTRDFTSRDEPWVFARVYRTGDVGDVPILLTTITDVETGRIVWTRSHQPPGSALAPNGEAPYRVALPISELPEGSYRLRIDATASGNARHASRELDFRVHAPSDAVPRHTESDLHALVERASGHVRRYLSDLSAVVAEETYEQSVVRSGLRTLLREGRRLRSDFLLVRLPGEQGWTPYRDVFEVDGKPVRDRDDRLHKLFLEMPEGSVDIARGILAEGTRYNIGSVVRNINQPTLPLLFLLPDNLHRFDLTLEGEDTIEGLRASRVDYKERVRPTFIQDGSSGNVPSSGSFWIDPTTGRIVRTILRATHRFSSMEIEVVYRPCAGTDLWAPAVMRESYRSPSERIYGTATYTNFRRFEVKTTETFRR